MLAAVGAAVGFDKVEKAPIALPFFCKTIRTQMETVPVESGPDRIILLDPAFESVIRILVAGDLELNLDHICEEEVGKGGITEIAAALWSQMELFVGGIRA